MLTKRQFLLAGGTALAGVAAYVNLSGSNTKMATSAKLFEVTRTKEEWMALLSPDRFAVLRQESTERAGSSPLLREKRIGTYNCAGCELALYRSETKYESGTGWPSFYQSIENAVATKSDYGLFLPRTEVHCRRCGGHLGHIFDDGPKPTGKRHCLNGLALEFQADEA